MFNSLNLLQSRSQKPVVWYFDVEREQDGMIVKQFANFCLEETCFLALPSSLIEVHILREGSS